MSLLGAVFQVERRGRVDWGYDSRCMPRVFGLVLALAWLACKSESDPLPPPGQGEAASPNAASGVGGGGGIDSSGSGEAGAPPLPTPADCGCLAAAGDEACRTCLDAASSEACVETHGVCEQVGVGYCALVFDCIGLCPKDGRTDADAYCVDTCLGAHDSARAAVEAFVACACAGCAEACGEGACTE